MERITKFWRLSSAEKFLLLRVTLLFTIIVPGLKLLPVRFLFGSISLLRRIPLLNLQTHSVAEIVRAVVVVGAHYPGAKCLSQALITLVLLDRVSNPATLRFGVAKDENGKLLAHAWLEDGTRVLIGESPDLSRFSVLSPSKRMNL